MRDSFRRAWYKAIPRLLSPKLRWRNVFGPISATIGMILDLGWSPSAPDRWKAGDLWWIYEPGLDTAEVERAIADGVSARLSGQAASAAAGAGLQGGPDLPTPSKLY